MASIKDIVAFLLGNYPHESEASNARVTKMVYLTDWRHAIEFGTQVTPICWKFDNFGPFVWDVKETAEASPDLFEMKLEANYYGSPKLRLALKNSGYVPAIGDTEKQAALHVIETTKKLGWQDFIRLVYSTYPVMRCPRYSTLDLPKLAIEYNATLRQSK